MLEFGPHLGYEGGRASTGWSGAQGSGSCLGQSSWEPQDPPRTLQPETWGPPPHTPSLEERLPVGKTRSPGPSWQPTAWAEAQQSQTHRGSHRRGAAAGRGRAAHCDQSHGVRPGAPGHRALPQPHGRSLPSRTRKERPELPGLAPPRGRPLKGQAPGQPGLRSQHPAAAAPPLPSPRALPASPPPPKHVGGGAGGWAQVRRPPTARDGPGGSVRPSPREAPAPSPALPLPAPPCEVTWAPFWASEARLPNRGGSQGRQDWERKS